MSAAVGALDVSVDGSEIPGGRRWLVSARLLIGTALAVLLSAGGIALAYSMAKHSTSQAHFTVFWLATIIGVGGLANLGYRQRSATVHRLSLLCLAILTFLPKLLMSWSSPLYFDEFGHWRHVNDLIATGDLFHSSSFLPIVKYYPGLSATTAAVHEVTRLSTWHSGQVVIFVAHCTTLLCVYGIAFRMNLTPRACLTAALIYAANPSYMYFDTQYAYESLGIALLLAAIYSAVRARRSTTLKAAKQWSILGAILGLACVLTHHVSSVVMIIVLVLIAAFVPTVVEPTEAINKTDRRIRLTTWVVPTATFAFFALWTGLVADAVFGYLEPHISAGVRQLVVLVTGGSETHRTSTGVVVTNTGHSLFKGSLSPDYEIAAGYLAPAAALLISAGGCLAIWRSRSQRRASVYPALPFLILALGYFLSLPFALTAGGGEAAHRSWAFTYLGVALLGSYFADSDFWLSRRKNRTSVAVLLAFLGLTLLVGNVSSGQNVYYRFPGPYLFGNDAWSKTEEGITLARWAEMHLPPGSKVVTDRTTMELITGYSDLNVVGPTESAANALFSQGGMPTPEVVSFLRSHHFRYFILDLRILDELPAQSFFSGYTQAGVDRSALGTIVNNDFIRVVHTTDHYAVYSLNP